ncbi:MAG: hypothetical protein IKZ48_08905 [Prevotella sp.]|nr:hypothetical protein [Prevotella sp.]
MLISAGVLMLAVLHLVHYTFINALLIIPLMFIIGGIIWHVYCLKKQSPY